MKKVSKAASQRLFHLPRSDIHSYGVKATWPMYEASMEIQRNIVKVAKEIFGE